MANISIYGSHNASIVVEDKGEIKLIVEIERLLNAKNQGMAQYKILRPDSLLFLTKRIIEYVQKDTNILIILKCRYIC